MADENETARAQQESEMKKHGITPASERQNAGKDSEADEDEDEDIEEDDSEESEDEEEDSADEEDEEETDEDEESEEEEDEEEDSQSHKKKGIPYKVYNDMRRDLREANRKLAEKTEAGKVDKEDVPDDFKKRVDNLVTEMKLDENGKAGIEKIMNLVNEIVKGSKEDFEKKLTDLEKRYSKVAKEIPIEDHYDKEWKSFEKSFVKEFPNATDEELESAQELMNELSHTKGIGGKAYKDADGRELLDPYELDYILYKNRDQFEEIIGGRRSKGMEEGRSQNIRSGRENKNENRPLPKNASPKELQEYAKRSSRLISSLDSLGTPIDDSI